MQKLPARHELPADVKWDIESIYGNESDFERDFAAVKGRLPELAAFRGQVTASATNLLRCLTSHDEISSLLEQIIVYARMRRDEDNANSTYQALATRAMSLATDFSSTISFLAPELLTLDDATLDSFMASEPALQVYRHYLEQVRLQRQHVRSAEVEEALAMAGEVARSPREIFGMLTDADLRFPVIRDEQGQDLELTQGRYVQFMESADRRVRREAFTALHSTYAAYRNTLTSSLSASVRRDVFYARARHYSSSLEAALQPENIPNSVYHNLVETVQRNLPLLHRYLALRRRMLGLDDLHMYDLHVPLMQQVKRDITFSDAVPMILEALAPLGQEYVSAMKQGIEQRWVDGYENEGKTSGAYSDGAYTTHPFILMSYQNNLSSVFTLAHELGHSMHSYYTRRSEPYIYGHYTIFVAEVASTLNEALLTQHLLSKSGDQQLRRYLINQYLDKFRTTLYRQTMFAEFELFAHQQVETGSALTPDLLCEYYRDLNAKYHGPEVVSDDGIAFEWSRIPHFYNAFYVYQYATGISAAIALSQQIVDEGQPATERYLKFLSSGESDYSIGLLQKAGVDMTSPEPVQRALDVFSDLLDQMEQLTADGSNVRANG